MTRCAMQYSHSASNSGSGRRIGWPTALSCLVWLLSVLTMGGCGVDMSAVVVDHQSKQPIAGATVRHERIKLQMLGIVPRHTAVLLEARQSDAVGRVELHDVRREDMLTVVGSANADRVERTWFRPLWPATDVDCGPDPSLAETYRALNGLAGADRPTTLYLPVRRAVDRE